MKTVRTQLWVSLSSDRGQASRPVMIDYSVNPIGSKNLYCIHHISDARTEEKYCVETTIKINGDLDAEIAKADPKQVAFAKKELGVDLKNLPKKKPVKKPVQLTETNDLLDGL